MMDIILTKQKLLKLIFYINFSIPISKWSIKHCRRFSTMILNSRNLPKIS